MSKFFQKLLFFHHFWSKQNWDSQSSSSSSSMRNIRSEEIFGTWLDCVNYNRLVAAFITDIVRSLKEKCNILGGALPNRWKNLLLHSECPCHTCLSVKFSGKIIQIWVSSFCRNSALAGTSSIRSPWYLDGALNTQGKQL